MYADPWSQPDAEEAAATPAQKSLQSTSAESDLSAFWPSRFDLGGPTKVSPSEQQLNAVGWPILASIWRDEQEPARQEPEPAFASWADRPEVPESAPELGCALPTLPSLAFALPTLEPEFEVQPKPVESSQPSADELLEASMHARVECVLDLIEDDGDDEIPEEEFEAVFVNEPKLSDMRQMLQAAGHPAEFSAGVLHISGVASIKRNDAGRFHVEGCASEKYFQIRDLIYKQFAIV